MNVHTQDELYEADIKKIIMLNSPEGVGLIDKALTVIYAYFAKLHKSNIDNTVRKGFVKISDSIHKSLEQNNISFYGLTFTQACEHAYSQIITCMKPAKKMQLLNSLNLSFIDSVERNGLISFNCEYVIPNTIKGEPSELFVWQHQFDIPDDAINSTISEDNNMKKNTETSNCIPNCNASANCSNDWQNKLLCFWNTVFNGNKIFKKPYLWENELSSKEYDELKSILIEAVECNGEGLLIKEHANKVALYVSEWFKREYEARSSNDRNAFESICMNNKSKEICEASFLTGYPLLIYKKENQNRWLYSLYVLGGMPLKYSNEGLDRLAQQIFRLYADDCDAVSFETSFLNEMATIKSIQEEEGSLNKYLRSFLNTGQLPINEEDRTSIGATLTSKFTEGTQKYDLFDWYWHFNYSNDDHYQLIGRTLEIKKMFDIFISDRLLKNHISYRYLKNHGINCNVNKIGLYLRFNGNSATNQLMWNCSNAYNDTFVCSGLNKMIEIFPSEKILKMEIVAKYDENEIVLQELRSSRNDFVRNGYVQLYKEKNSLYRWTDRVNTSTKTMLLFEKDKYQIETSETQQNTIPKTRRFPETENIYYSCIDIVDSIVLKSGDKAVKTFYCKNNGVELEFIPCQSIDYIERCRCQVKRKTTIEDDYGNTINNEGSVTLIGGKQWIKIKFYETKEEQKSSTNSKDVTYECNLQFYKKLDDKHWNWVEWDENNQPRQGFVNIRAKYKETESNKYEVYYLPAFDEANIVKRNIKSSEQLDANVIYFNKYVRFLDSSHQRMRVSHKTDENAIFFFGEQNDHIELSVFSPVKIRQILLNGIVVKSFRYEDEIEIPYILRKDLTLRTINENGTSIIDLANKEEEKYGLDLYYQMDIENIKKPTVTRDSDNIKYYMWKNIWDGNSYPICPGTESEYRFYFCALPSFEVTELSTYIQEKYNQNNNKFQTGLSKLPENAPQDKNGFIFQACKDCSPLFYAKYHSIGNWNWYKTENQNSVYIIGDKREEDTLSLTECQIKCFNLCSDYFIPFRMFDPLNRLCDGKDSNLVNFFIEYCKTNELTTTRLDSFWFFAKSYCFEWILLNPKEWNKIDYIEYRPFIYLLFKRMIENWSENDMDLFWDKSDTDWLKSDMKLTNRLKRKKIEAIEAIECSWINSGITIKKILEDINDASLRKKIVDKNLAKTDSEKKLNKKEIKEILGKIDIERIKTIWPIDFFYGKYKVWSSKQDYEKRDSIIKCLTSKK